ncbi:MAG: InlB B-repeat-containing protein, partial [Coriobacteriales bacterium]|nr:InlB B-repeat-containing protein [Coriobacteriales bacterium]
EVRTSLYRNDELVATTNTASDGSYRFDHQPVAGSYKVGFENPNAEDLSFTVAGEHHTATTLRESPLGSARENYYGYGETPAATLAAHSEGRLNAGFYRIPSYTVTFVPNGGTGEWGSADEYTLTIKEGRLVPGQTVVRAADGSYSYAFDGWRLSTEDGRPWDFAADTMPAADIRLVAAWAVTALPVPPPPSEPAGPPAPYVPVSYIPSPETPAGSTTLTASPTPLADLSSTGSGGEGSTTTLPDEEVALAAAGTPAWALLNLILTVIGAILSIFFLALYLNKRRRKESEEDVEERRRRSIEAQMHSDQYEEEPETDKKRLVWRVIAILLAIVALFLFILTEDVRLPMVLIDHWTIAHVVIMVVQIVCWIVASRRKKRNEEDTDAEMVAARQSLGGGSPHLT